MVDTYVLKQVVDDRTCYNVSAIDCMVCPYCNSSLKEDCFVTVNKEMFLNKNALIFFKNLYISSCINDLLK